MQNDVGECAQQVASLESQLSSRMQQLHTTVQSKSAVPTAQVYVSMITLPLLLVIFVAQQYSFICISFWAALLKAFSVIPPVTVVWSVRLYVCLSHSCTVLKPLDGMRYHLAGTLVWSEVTVYYYIHLCSP